MPKGLLPAAVTVVVAVAVRRGGRVSARQPNSGAAVGGPHRATSARVPHTGADAATNLLLVISTSGLRATDRGINVYYHVGHQRYHLRTEVGLTTVVASKCTA